MYEFVYYKVLFFTWNSLFGFAFKSINGTMDLPIWNLTRTHKYTDTDHPSFAIKISYLRRMRKKNCNAKKTNNAPRLCATDLNALYFVDIFFFIVFHRSCLILCLIQSSFCAFFIVNFFLRISVLVCMMRQVFAQNIRIECKKKHMRIIIKMMNRERREEKMRRKYECSSI